MAALTSRGGARTARSVSTGELTTHARALEVAVLKGRLVTRAEVDAHRPGAPLNTDTGAHGALQFLLWLSREHSRGERTEAQMAAAAQAAAAVRPVYEQTVEDALRSAPERVALDPVSERLAAARPRAWRLMRALLRAVGAGRTVARLDAPRAAVVFPKSRDGLWFVACQDFRVRWLARAVRLTQAHTFATSPDLLESLCAELAYRYGLLAWAVTTPGPFLPFDPLDPPRTLPPHVLAMSDRDLQTIHGAYLRVHGARLHALRTFYSLSADPDAVVPADDDPPSWNQFFASRMVEDGVRGEELYRQRDLPSLVAAAVVAAEARARALAQATTDAEAAAAQAKAARGADAGARAGAPT